MTEGPLESLSETNNFRSLGVSSDDGRAFLSVERRMEIVKIINMHKSVTVAEIVEGIGTSPATVRRDLTWLDGQGLIGRTHGGATPIDYPSQTKLREIIPANKQTMNKN